MRYSTKLHAVIPSLQAIAREKVAEYREAHPLNAEAYRRLGALAMLENLMDSEGTEWVEIQAMRLATERRIRGVK